MIKIKSAEFIKGAVGPDKIFEDGGDLFVFIGRSNVGKSSLINAITKCKSLSKTSSSPGKTKEINLFLIDNKFYIVDLPGYGYAKVSMEMRKKMEKMINWFLFISPYVHKKIFLIIDSRIGPTKDDLEILKALEDHQKEIVIIVNKIDKLNRSEQARRMKEIKEAIGNHETILHSATKGTGYNEILENIYDKL